jgi:hypothetical protein
MPMGYIDFDADKPLGRRVATALQRRGLVRDPSWEWEMHSLHGDMSCHVLTGRVRIPADMRPGFFVAIYPQAVYEIEDVSKWWDVGPDQRIPTVATK